MINNNNNTIRSTLLSIVLVVLLISAGCNEFNAGSTDVDTRDGGAEPSKTVTSTPTPTKTPAPTHTATPTPAPDPTATDLREIEVQVLGSEDYAPNTLGEIDRGDPSNENGYHEPVIFAAQANDTINVTLSASTSGDPRVKLRAPNGTTLDTDDDGGLGDAAKIENETLPVTGRYTVIATASEDSSTSTFAYHLTVDRGADEGELEPEESEVQETGWYASDATTWNESERYGEWAADFATTANSPNGASDSEPSYWVNSEEDYVVITMIDGDFYNVSQRQDIVASLAATNVQLHKTYMNESNEQVNGSWVPDRTYVRFVTPEKRNLLRVHALTNRSAAKGADMSGHGVGPSIDDYFYTMHRGPASYYYEEGSSNSIESRDDLDYIDVDSELKPPDSDRDQMNKTTSINETGA